MKRTFVVMPFGQKSVTVKTPSPGPNEASVNIDFDAVYEMLLKPALAQAGSEPFRADDQVSAGDIRTDMYFELVTADYVLADISALNPNVFYELGVRHAARPDGFFSVKSDCATARAFDIAPDRSFAYKGELFLTPAERGPQWDAAVAAEAERLAAVLREVMGRDRQTVSSPVYKELENLRPTDWSRLGNARGKYFRGLAGDWRTRIKVARARGWPGAILTLAREAPTQIYRTQILRDAARSLIDLERYEAALDLIEEILADTPGDLEAGTQRGLALGRLGRPDEALIYARELQKLHRGDPELQGILGRLHKDFWRMRWHKEEDPEARRQKAVDTVSLARTSLESYWYAFARDPGSYYAGINALGLALLVEHLTGQWPSGEVSVDRATIEITVRFAADGKRLVTDNGSNDWIWIAATLGELALFRGETQSALNWYSEACSAAMATEFQRRSMLHQMELYHRLGFLPDTTGPVTAWLRQQTTGGAMSTEHRHVIVASGHRIDAPGRPQPRFPPSQERAVAARIAAYLDEWGIGAGDLAMSGAANGCDILFAEACLQRGARVRLLLPKPEGRFVPESVELPGSKWVKRFEDLADSCEVWHQDEQLGLPIEKGQEHSRNNLWLLETARTELRKGHLYGLLVWDGKSTGDGPGGTSHFAQMLGEYNARRRIIDPLTAAAPDAAQSS